MKTNPQTNSIEYTLDELFNGATQSRFYVKPQMMSIRNSHGQMVVGVNTTQLKDTSGGDYLQLLNTKTR